MEQLYSVTPYQTALATTWACWTIPGWDIGMTGSSTKGCGGCRSRNSPIRMQQ